MEKGEVMGLVGRRGISRGNDLDYEVIKKEKRIKGLNLIYGSK